MKFEDLELGKTYIDHTGTKRKVIFKDEISALTDRISNCLSKPCLNRANWDITNSLSFSEWKEFIEPVKIINVWAWMFHSGNYDHNKRWIPSIIAFESEQNLRNYCSKYGYTVIRDIHTEVLEWAPPS